MANIINSAVNGAFSTEIVLNGTGSITIREGEPEATRQKYMIKDPSPELIQELTDLPYSFLTQEGNFLSKYQDVITNHFDGQKWVKV